MATEETSLLQPRKKARMKHTRKKACMKCIPSEIIEQILLRVPASSLVRCRAVCKKWLNIIKNPQFIMAHLQVAPRHTLLFFPKGTFSRKRYPSDMVLFDEAWTLSTRAVTVIEPNDILCASCNGLVCFYTNASTIKIANLATGEHLHIKKPVKKSSGDDSSYYSLGFHPTIEEYKVIHRWTEDTFDFLQVYTLGDDGWRNVKAQSLHKVKYFGFHLGVVNVDGSMYWLVEDMESKWGYRVLSFDLKEESFLLIEPPPINLEEADPFCVSIDLGEPHVTEIGGKVCVVVTIDRTHLVQGFLESLQIWSLESKMEQIWGQKYNISIPPNPSFRFTGPFIAQSNKLIVEDGDYNICCHELQSENFNIKLNKMVRLLDFGPHRQHGVLSYVHVNSLVPLDKYKKARIVCKSRQWNWWEVKPWLAWTYELRKIRKLWNDAHQMEHNIVV